MYQALYRKYRPQTFSDVCGQDHISKTLKNQIDDKRPSHAYLFTGSRGTGKTSSAKIFAKAVNCLNPVGGDPCNECEICRGIDNGSILDVVEIDAASNNGVDNIRELRDQIEYTPVKAKYRVYIIDEVHMLSPGAFNALLKTLEEPPAHAIFILATTEVHKIPATILSRCQRYDFFRISADVIAERIKYICNLEQIVIDDNAAVLIARLADGGMRDALSLLDLCAGTDKNITEQLVANCAGLVGNQHLFEFAKLIEEKNAGGVLQHLNSLYAASCDIERLCTELIAHYRNLLVAKTSKSPRELITATNEEIDNIIAQSKAVKFESILNAVEKLAACLENMKKGAVKRTVLETALIRLCNPAMDTAPEAVLARIAKLEDAVVTGIVPKAVPNAKAEEEVSQPEVKVEEKQPEKVEEIIQQPVAEQPVAEPEKVQTPVAAAPSDDTEMQPFLQWAEVMSRLQKVSPLIHAVMTGSVAYTKGDILFIDAPNSQFTDLIRGDSRHKESIKNAVLAVTGTRYRLGPYKKPENVDKPKKADPLDDFINDFGGNVAEVE
ncbi:MAG: DNA polymerase III subunit gamma/tau [Clostridia bacterium]|nr:DNA polymerase III subunit gamma/tau [Clostridia bacterium]